MGTSSIDLDAVVAQHFAVGEVFDVLQLLVVERGEVREVEAQMRGIDQRARLLHVLAQHLAQRGMQQVRAGVVAHGVFAIGRVNYTYNLVSGFDRIRAENPRPRPYRENVDASYRSFTTENIRNFSTTVF